jgi:hypothetical protein
MRGFALWGVAASLLMMLFPIIGLPGLLIYGALTIQSYSQTPRMATVRWSLTFFMLSLVVCAISSVGLIVSYGAFVVIAVYLVPTVFLLVLTVRNGAALLQQRRPVT